MSLCSSCDFYYMIPSNNTTKEEPICSAGNTVEKDIVSCKDYKELNQELRREREAKTAQKVRRDIQVDREYTTTLQSIIDNTYDDAYPAFVLHPASIDDAIAALVFLKTNERNNRIPSHQKERVNRRLFIQIVDILYNEIDRVRQIYNIRVNTLLIDIELYRKLLTLYRYRTLVLETIISNSTATLPTFLDNTLGLKTLIVPRQRNMNEPDDAPTLKLMCDPQYL